MLPRPLDTTIAHKMINLMPELTGTDKRIAAAIIEHFNRKSGQCDPGLGRIAWLVGASRRTAIRSVSRIVETGILRMVRHGGHSQRNSYEPVWSRFREIEAAWKMRFRAKSRRAHGSKMSPATCQRCHLPGDQPVTQTLLTNQSKETRSGEPASAKHRRSGKPTDRKGQPGKARIQAIQDITPAAAGPTNGRRIGAAHAAAERRWSAALHERFSATPELYGKVIEAMDIAMQSAATAAEMKKPGTGLVYIVEQLRAREAAGSRDEHTAVKDNR